MTIQQFCSESVLSDSSFDERGPGRSFDERRTGSKTAGSSSGVSSDLSDSDNDYKVDSDNDSPDYKEQFIESGIFEEEEMEIKMELEKELEVKRMVAKTKKEVLREAKGTQTLEVDQQISQLNEEIVKLTQIRSLVEQRVSPSTKDPSESSGAASKTSEYPSGVLTSSPLSKVSEYGSCEELEMINGPGRYDHQAELRALSGKLREMEQKWEVLYTAHQEVVEERCELEEAENDSRLRAQKLESQYTGALERSQIIKDELILERQNNEELKYQLEEFLGRDERNQEDLESLQLHIQEQEGVIRELEEREMYFSEQLHLLEMGVRISGWWRAWAWLLNPEGEGGEVDEEGDGKTRRDDVLQLLESQRASVGEVKAEAEERELELIGKVKELEEEYERFLEELVTLVGYGENAEKRMEVVERVAALIQAEINLKKQVSDLEKKETAYSKTIQEADTIMARVELSYQERIKELEQEKHDLKERLWEMEERSQQVGVQREEMKTITELVGKLEQVEQAEAALKERVRLLEEEREEMRSKVNLNLN